MYTAVSDLVTKTQPPTYAHVLQVDQQIEDMFMGIPEYCRIRAESDSIADPPQIILQRIFIQMNHHKAQVVLHWRYLTLENKEGRYSYSNRRTVLAALKILKLHRTIYEGLKPGGRLYSVRWRVTCFFSHDYLLAISILCFYLQRHRDAISDSELNEIKETLHNTNTITGSRTPMSAEVKRAALAIESALPGFLEPGTDQSPTDSQVVTPAGSSDRTGFSNDQGNLSLRLLTFEIHSSLVSYLANTSEI